MKEYIVERVLTIAEHILETGATVRACASKFDVSKTTVHKDMCQRLKQVDPGAAEDVRRVLDLNKADRHIRGGAATKRKYSERREHKEAVGG